MLTFAKLFLYLIDHIEFIAGEAIVSDLASNQEALDRNEVRINKTEETCNSPTLGKRLSKRTKVAPKLTQKKIHKTDFSEVSSSPVCSQTSSPVCSTNLSTECSEKRDNEVSILTENISEQKVLDTANETVNQSDKESLSNKSSEIDINKDVIEVDNLLTGNQDTTVLHDNNDKPKNTVQSSIESKDTSTVCVFNDNPETEIIKENKLLKRTRKVMPNLKTQSFNRKKDDIPKEVGKEIVLISKILPAEETCDNKRSDVNKQDHLTDTSKESNSKPLCEDTKSGMKSDGDACLTNTKNEEYQDVKCINDIKEGITKTSRLQKRVKVRPKLKARVNVTASAPSEKRELECSDILKKESINKGIKDLGMDNVETMLPSAQTITGEINYITDNEFDRTKNVTMIEPQITQCSGNSENNADYINSFDERAVNKKNEKSWDASNYIITNKVDTLIKNDIVLDKKELKHVRFTSEDDYKNIDYNDNSNDNDFRNDTYLTEISSKQCSPDNSDPEDDTASKLPNCTENASGKYDSNDECDSMSEGEMLGKQLVSKNKVFKPNLGAKRRERLSSFSAYSSCDEEDWQNQKRRKKEKAKVNILFCL